MQQKQEFKESEQSTIRYRILKAHYMMINSFAGPHIIIEIMLEVLLYVQLLKFPIDYFSEDWFGVKTTIFHILDPFYFIRITNQIIYTTVFMICLACMLIYIIFMASLLKEFSATVTKIIGIITKVSFLIFSKILYAPSLGLILNINGCKAVSKFYRCSDYSGSTSSETYFIIGIIILTLFSILIALQALLQFNFLPIRNKHLLLKDSSYVAFLLIPYIAINEIVNFSMSGIANLIVLNVSIIILIIAFAFKDEHQMMIPKRIQTAMLGINFVAIALLDIKKILSFPIYFPTVILVGVAVILFCLFFEMFSIKFELENVNKWNTANIVLRYTRTLRLMVSRLEDDNDQYQIILQGYSDIHRQKCQMQQCPYRPNNEPNYYKKWKQSGDKVVERTLTHQIIKVIYRAGIKITPVNPQVQLQYSIFLYSIKQRDQALKNLITVQSSQLSLDKFYKYFVLRNRIKFELDQEPRQFLDLISEIQVQRMQNQLMKKFQQCALVNLEFWSVLNEDHPDFQKLNDIGTKRVAATEEIKEKYQSICNFAHSQRITNLYIHYLSSIENYQEVYNMIHSIILQKYKLEEKIIMQDWDNSSLPTFLVSSQDATYGNITDLNSTFASMLGYEKYQLLNRHIKVIFSDQLKLQIDSFMSQDQQHKADTFYLQHKNGYLIRINRKAQSYNSMRTGFTVIMTFSFQFKPNTAFIVVEDTQFKILGCSSSCISFFGIQSKVFESYPYLSDILNLQRDFLKSNFNFNNMIYTVNDIFKENVTNMMGNEENYDQIDGPSQFSISFSEAFKGIKVFQTVLLNKKRVNNLQDTDIHQFKFQIFASLSEFSFVGEHFDNGQSYLRQFSQLSYHQEVKQSLSIKKYDQGVTTLRLFQNIIRVIQDIQEEELQSQASHLGLSSQVGFFEKISRKDQELIFQSKSTFIQFIRSQRITLKMHYIIGIGLILTVVIYGVFFYLFQSHNVSGRPFFTQIANQNFIIGSMAKQSSFLQSLKLMNQGKSSQNFTKLSQDYKDNMEKLQLIRLTGSKSFSIPVYTAENVTNNYYSDEFLLSFLNYGRDILNTLGNATTTTEFQSKYSQIDSTKLFFMTKNGVQGKKYLNNKLIQRSEQIKQDMQSFIVAEIIMLVSGIVAEIIFGFVIVFIIWKIHQQKIMILKAFLAITQLDIVKYSSKTERFLTSLHMQDSTGDDDIDLQQGENKKSSAFYAKTKRFKVIKLDKCIYVKLLFLPLLAMAFFIHGFVVSNQNLSLMKKNVDYTIYTTSGDKIFYGGLKDLQTITESSLAEKISINYLQYYRDYFDSHYVTFGKIQKFHHYFTKIFMFDICAGEVQIPDSCQLDLLAVNGSLLIFTDVTVQTQQKGVQDFPQQYYLQYEILSKTHSMLTQQVLNQQNNLINSTYTMLLNIFLIWSICLIAIGLLYGGPTIYKFLDQINSNKNMLTILPISIAKESYQVNRFIKGSINYKCCF